MYTHTHTATVLSLHFAGGKKGTGDDEKREEKDEKHQNEKRTEKEGASRKRRQEKIHTLRAPMSSRSLRASSARSVSYHTHTHTHTSVCHAHIHKSAASTNAAGQA